MTISFIAINEDNNSLPSNTLKNSQDFTAWKQEYESITILSLTDLEGAWTQLQKFLEGELFSQRSILPLVQELQMAALQLALDMANRLADPSMGDWALEAAEWFPDEAYFWLKLGEAKVIGGLALTGLKGLLFRKSVLGRAQNLLPGDRQIKWQLDQVNAVLGSWHGKVNITNSSLVESVDWIPSILPTLPSTRQIRINQNTKLCNFVREVLEVTDDILGLKTLTLKRPRNVAAASSNNHSGIKLMLPIEILVESVDEHTNLLEEVESLPLSQAGSLRNLRDTTSSQGIRSSRKVTGAPTLATRKESLAINQLCQFVNQSLESVKEIRTSPVLVRSGPYLMESNPIPAELNPFIATLIDVEKAWEELVLAEQCPFTNPTERNDPLAMSLIGESIIIGTLDLLIRILQVFTGLQSPHFLFTPLFRKLSATLITTDIDYVTSHLDLFQLMWWCENLHTFEIGNDEIIVKIIGIIQIRISQMMGYGMPSLLDIARFLHLKYLIYRDEKYLEILQAVIDAQSVLLLPSMMDLDGKIPQINSNVLLLKKISIQKETTLTKLGHNPQETWSLVKPISWYLENIPLRGLPSLITNAIPTIPNEKLDDPPIQSLVASALLIAIKTRDIFLIKKLLLTVNPKVLHFLLQINCLDELVSLTYRSSEFLSCFAKLLTISPKTIPLPMVNTISYLLRDVEDWKSLNDGSTLALIAESSLSFENSTEWALKYTCYTALVGSPVLEMDTTQIDSLAKDIIDCASSLRAAIIPQAAHLLSCKQALIKLVLDSTFLRNGQIDTFSFASWCEWMISSTLEELEKKEPFYHADVMQAWKHIFVVPSSLKTKLPLSTMKSYYEVGSTLCRLYSTAQEYDISFYHASKIKKKGNLPAEEWKESQMFLIRLLVLLRNHFISGTQVWQELRYTLEIELYHLFSLSSVEIREASQMISKLAIGIFNCYRWGGPSAGNLLKDLTSLLSFAQSCKRGALEMFTVAWLPLLIEFIKKKLSTWSKALSLTDWIKFRSILSLIIPRNLVDTIQAITELAQLFPENFDIDSIFHKVCQAIEIFLETNVNNHTEEQRNKFIQDLQLALTPIIKVNNDQDMVLTEAAMSPHSFHQQLADLLQSISSQCSNKIAKYRLTAILAQIQNYSSLSEMIERWSAVLPFLCKPRTPNPFAIWQAEFDPPGDYYSYVERYTLGAARSIARYEAPIEEKVRWLGLIKSRVEQERDRHFIRPHLVLNELKMLMGSIEKNKNDMISKEES